MGHCSSLSRGDLYGNSHRTCPYSGANVLSTTSKDIDTNLQYLQLADDPVVVIIIVITAPAEAHNGTAAQKPDNNNRNSSNNNCGGDEERGDVRDEYEACAGCGHLMLCCCH